MSKNKNIKIEWSKKYLEFILDGVPYYFDWNNKEESAIEDVEIFWNTAEKIIELDWEQISCNSITNKAPPQGARGRNAR